MLQGIIEVAGSLLPVESYLTARSHHLEALLAQAWRAYELALDPPFGMKDLVGEGRIEDTIFFTQVELARLRRITGVLEVTFPEEFQEQ